MTRATKLSAGLAFCLFSAAALAMFPGTAAAQTLNIRIESETGGLLLPNSDIGDFTHEPKNGQEPNDHGNDYDSIQDRLNGAGHWDV
jgi:hypothetical protein